MENGADSYFGSTVISDMADGFSSTGMCTFYSFLHYIEHSSGSSCNNGGIDYYGICFGRDRNCAYSGWKRGCWYWLAGRRMSGAGTWNSGSAPMHTDMWCISAMGGKRNYPAVQKAV